MRTYSLSVKNLVKRYDGFYAVNDVSFDVEKGEFLTIVGPSGAGKTTIMRMVAGFEEPTSGEIFIDGKSVLGLPPNKRNICITFQSFALFPHMSVGENIEYGLKLRGVDKEIRRKKAEEMLETVNLKGFYNRRVTQLSSGEQQRVSLARALITDPSLLFLDEPLGNLDEKLRKSMQLELKRLQTRLGKTFICITHHQEEALTMSDRVIILNKGKVEQIGTPQEIYEHPKTKFVAEFIGEANLFNGTVKRVEESLVEVQSGEITLNAYEPNHQFNIGESVWFFIRPEKIIVGKQFERENNLIEGKIVDVTYKGSTVEYMIDVPSGLKFKVSSQLSSATKMLDVGEKVILKCPKENVIVLKQSQ